MPWFLCYLIPGLEELRFCWSTLSTSGSGGWVANRVASKSWCGTRGPARSFGSITGTTWTASQTTPFELSAMRSGASRWMGTSDGVHRVTSHQPDGADSPSAPGRYELPRRVSATSSTIQTSNLDGSTCASHRVMICFTFPARRGRSSNRGISADQPRSITPRSRRCGQARSLRSEPRTRPSRRTSRRRESAAPRIRPSRAIR
jgi:hypothetical protein